jgi:hypothetical protein
LHDLLTGRVQQQLPTPIPPIVVEECTLRAAKSSCSSRSVLSRPYMCLTWVIAAVSSFADTRVA